MTNEDQNLVIQNCSVLWGLHNVKKDHNDKFLKDGNEITVPPGYYTFTSLKDFLAGENITIEKNASGMVSLTADKDLNLKKFGVLLGFLEDKNITKNIKTTGIFTSNLGSGLREIDIHCSLVDSSRNFDYEGKPTDLLLSIPVDTTQPTFGAMTHYNFQGLKIPCKQFYGHDIKFKVVSSENTGKYDYSIFLRLGVKDK